MARSIKKGPYVDAKLEKKIVNMAEGKVKKGVIKTWSRRSTITPDLVIFSSSSISPLSLFLY